MDSIKDKKNHYGTWCFLLNLLIAFIIFLPFIIQGGGLFSLGDDFDAQEIPFNIFVNREIKELDVFFNWGIDLGSDFISSFSFYNLGSPFFWITLLFRPEAFPWLVVWILILKYAAAGLISFYWLRRHTSDRSALIGSVLYAFSGFQAMNMIFYHFHDIVALFPLLLIGFEILVEEKRKGIFALTVAINALVNWNFFVGEVIFLVLYYFCYCDVINALLKKKVSFKEVWKQLIGLMGEGLLGIGMAAVLFIPSVYAMLGQSRIKELMSLKDGLLWSPEDLFRNIKAVLFPAEAMNNNSVLSAMNWYSAGAYLPFIGIVPCAARMICYRKRKDPVNRILLISLILSAVPILNSVFVLFNREPYRRWYYMPLLLMSLASVQAMEDLQAGDSVMRKTALKVSAFVLGIMVIFVAAVSTLEVAWDGSPSVRIPFNWTSVVLTGVAGIILTMIIIAGSGKTAGTLRLFTVGICCFAVLSQSLTILEYRSRAEFSSRQLNNKLVLLTGMIDKDILPYRYAFLESDGYFNFSMTQSLPSIDSFISIVDPGIVEFYDALGVGRHTRTVSGPIGTERLLSVKQYVLDHPDPVVFPEKIPRKIYENDGMKRYVYEDIYALSIGQGYTTYILRSEFDKVPDKFRADAMLHYLVIRDEDESKVRDVLIHGDYREFFERDEVWIPDIDVIGRNCCEQLTVARKAFGAVYNSGENAEYVFFSVPYSDRWSAVVNGQPVEILNINGLMAIPVTGGRNEIRFDYDISIVLISACICMISVLIEMILLFKSRRRVN